MDGENIENEDNGFKIKGAATRNHQKTKQAVQDACTICLEAITERAVAVPCNHLSFDFLCLVSWLQEQPTCPLCKSKVTDVQYDWRGPEDFLTYNVPELEASKAKSATQQGRWRYPLPRRRRDARPFQTQAESVVGQDASLEQRRHVYRYRLYSLHVGANRVSQYRDFTAQDFAVSTDLQSRARTFLRRELQVFTFLDSNPRGGNRDFLIEYVVAVLKQNELRGADGRVEDLVKDFLGLENTRQLLHELEAWLRSPYTSLRDWDAHVQYADRRQTTRKS